MSNYLYTTRLRKYRLVLLAVITSALLISGCGLVNGSNSSYQPSQTSAQELILAASPSSVPSLLPGSTATPTVTPTATYTPTPTPHPLSIEGMRSESYPGSDLVIEEKLASASNYERMIVSYQSEGLKINAYMTIPFGQPPETGWPVIVFNHGYIPPDIYRPTERYIAYVDGFARNGYIVLRPDYRGHADSEGEARGAYSRPDYTIDVLNAIASIQRYPLADPERIGMWGHSMGGHITLRVMVTTSWVKAGVIWAGVVASYPDMMYRWRSTPPSSIPSGSRRWRTDFIETYGDPTANPGFWASISPISYVTDLSGPLQIHHGEDDEDVPIAFSESLYEAVLAAGIEVEYYAYPGNDHNLSQSFSVAMQRSIDFFDLFLK